MRFGVGTGSFRAPVRYGFRAALLATVLVMPQAGADTSARMRSSRRIRRIRRLLAERANLRATDEDVSQAIAQWRPRISINADYSKIHAEAKTDGLPRSLSRTEPWGADVTATQTVFAGGRILAQRRQADANGQRRPRATALDRAICISEHDLVLHERGSRRVRC